MTIHPYDSDSTGPSSHNLLGAPAVEHAPPPPHAGNVDPVTAETSPAGEGMTAHVDPVYVAPAQQATPYDSIWAGGEVPVQERTGIERVMLAEDKLFVVLAVVLIIWIGLALLIFRTDRRIDRLERKLNERIPEESSEI